MFAIQFTPKVVRVKRVQRGYNITPQTQIDVIAKARMDAGMPALPFPVFEATITPVTDIATGQTILHLSDVGEVTYI